MTEQPPTKLAFVDCETTGLDPDVHEIWEVGLIIREPVGADLTDEHPWRETEYLWQLPVDLGRADSVALNVGNYQHRRYFDVSTDQWGSPTDGEAKARALLGDPTERYVVPKRAFEEWARRFADMTWGVHLVGAVVSFDEERLRRLLRRHGACPGWHYHLVDVEALAAGWIRGRYGTNELAEAGAVALPWSSHDLSAAVGVDPGDYDRHTALGDARWARAIYDAVIGQ